MSTETEKTNAEADSILKDYAQKAIEELAGKGLCLNTDVDAINKCADMARRYMAKTIITAFPGLNFNTILEIAEKFTSKVVSTAIVEAANRLLEQEGKV